MKLLPSALLLVLSLAGSVEAQTPSQRPYTLPQIITLLEGRFRGEEILRRIGDACISFRIDPSSEAELRSAGANDALLTGLRSLCHRGEPERPSSARGVLYIEGELPPGWSRKVNELEPNTNREIDLTPGRQAIILISAPGWCPDQRQVNMAGGDTVRWRPTLRGRPWVGGC